MGLLDGIMAAASLHQQNTSIKNARSAILTTRDRLRGTRQFAELFYKIVGNPERPPIQIVGDYCNHAFYSISWDEQGNNYEPYSTLKMTDGNIAYYESAAIFLLLQECYPNVYDFPNRTVKQIEAGVPVELNMKKNFIGKKLRPAILPEKPNVSVSQPVATSTEKKFCTHCGKQLDVTARFCSGCGGQV